MAFVFRSTKGDTRLPKKEDFDECNSLKEKLDLIKEKKDSLILNNNSSFNSNISQKTKIPFGALSKKCDLPNLKGKNVPGPGTYDINDNLIKNHFNKNNTSPVITENDDENTKRLFISQQKRFNNSQYETDVPGPGKYFKDKKNFFKYT